ncbi:MAG: 3-hydroxybutyryl-CoA dehydrogenase [Thauera sp.]|jgi:3-hydroxybutyryl-CoA dehydrogenase|nr:3-hydroxybutyryl-CoA dehydrogenase [Thauera sp.]MBP8216369.1 3-hydroxybutyryl-CoA dehydrogenase [Thauera sp.]MBP8922084.1 3-hydroxybutyryl-CoA dehydrogenase [Thauera sp.]HQV08304.1 3-hydroxybutyryl-CoA dehydrogenase [Thauera sp.]
MGIGKIGVVGAGTMGNGIAQALAVAGRDVVMMDVGDAQVKRGLDTIGASLDRLIKKDKMSAADKAAAMARISTATSTSALADCDLVIEAATEKVDLKLRIFAELDSVVKPEAILASNTSSISITRLAAGTKRPSQVIGMHFFNPVPVMALVELINGLQTSAATYAAVEELAKSIGKSPIKVKNSPGFVVNRMLCPMINEAVFVLGEGLATAAEIDEAMKLGCNHPIGPLALCDLIGLDVELAVMQVLYEGTKDPKYRPAPLLVEMLEAGYLGRKSGKGFFDYPAK